MIYLTNFITVTEPAPDLLKLSVDAQLAQGLVTLGQPYVSQDPKGRKIHCQPMSRRSEQKPIGGRGAIAARLEIVKNY